MQNDNNHLTDGQILRDYLAKVPSGIVNKVVARMVEHCLVTKYVFANWRYDRCRIPLSGKRDINTITREVSGIEIFTIAKPGEAAEGVSGNTSGVAIQ